MTQKQLQEWYRITSAEEIDPVQEQERIEILIDQTREDGIHSHTGRR